MCTFKSTMTNKHSFFVTLFLLITFTGFSQINFSVSPGLGLNTAQVGYKVNSKVIPFFGFQYASGSLSYTDKGERYDSDQGAVVSYEETEKTTGGIFLPNLGVKYFLATKEKVSTYGLASLSIPIITGKFEDQDGEVTSLSDDLDKFGTWGAELGFGAEYFFDKSFSIGGEFGLRYIRANISETYETSVFDPNSPGSSRPSETSDIFKASLNPTYTKIALNFYF